MSPARLHVRIRRVVVDATAAARGAEVAGSAVVSPDYTVADLPEAARVIEGLIGPGRADRYESPKECAEWILSHRP